MSRHRQSLIDDLVADLRPVDRPGRIGRGVAGWLAVSWAYGVVVTFTTGPIRPGALGNLLEHPAFALETLVAWLAVALLARAAARSAIPGEAPTGRSVRWALLPLIAWVAVYVIGLRYPAHPVSKLGAREGCVWQVALYSTPALLLMLWFARRQYVLWPRITGSLAGAAAAAIVASLMQFACMYVPAHILTHHIAPIFAMAGVGAAVGPRALAIRTSPPRSSAAARPSP